MNDKKRIEIMTEALLTIMVGGECNFCWETANDALKQVKKIRYEK